MDAKLKKAKQALERAKKERYKARKILDATHDPKKIRKAYLDFEHASIKWLNAYARYTKIKGSKNGKAKII